MGNWMISFLSPLVGTSIAFNLPIEDMNMKVLITSLLSSMIVTGIVIGKSLENAK